MPPWLAIAMGLLGIGQGFQQQGQFNEALRASQQGLSPEEAAELERTGMAGVRTDLSRRGLMDSGLLAGGRAAVTGEIALARARARQAGQGSYIQALLSRANRPSLFGAMVPIMMQQGVRNFSGGWFIPPFGGPPGGQFNPGGGYLPGGGTYP